MPVNSRFAAVEPTAQHFECLAKRFPAVATGGTCTFLTDHSGIGDSHSELDVPGYNVECLNDLMMRRISEYVEITL